MAKRTKRESAEEVANVKPAETQKTEARKTEAQKTEAKKIEIEKETRCPKTGGTSSFDALLKSALSASLLQEENQEAQLAAANGSAGAEHVFSPEFEASIKRAILQADNILAEDASLLQAQEQDQKQETKKIAGAETGGGQRTILSAAQLSDRRSARAAQREKAGAAQARLFEQLHLRRGRRMLVNAASLLLVFGLGIFVLRQQGASETDAEAVTAKTEMTAAEPAVASFKSARAADSAAAPTMGAAPETARASIANPIQEVSGPEAFSETLGFSLTAEQGTQHTALQYSIISDEIAQIQYHCEALQSDVTLRAARGTEALTDGSQIAGVYYAFDEAREKQFAIEKDGQAVTASLQFVKTAAPGEAAGALATWKAGELIYSLWVETISQTENAQAENAMETEVRLLLDVQA